VIGHYSVSVRRFAVFASLAAALAVAGCGGDGGGGGGGAEVAPRDALAFIVLNTDFESDEWQQAEELAGRFPDGREALRRALAELGEENLDLGRDVDPALGPEVDVVVLPAGADAEPHVVLLTQPDDPAKLDALIARADAEVATAEIDGWTALAEDEAALDALREGEGSLADSDAFEEAMGKLPEDALARVFVNGPGTTALAQGEGELTPDERALVDCLSTGSEDASGAFALSAEEEGVRLQGAVEAGDVDVPDAAQSALAAALPADALAFVSTRGLGEQARRVLRCISDSNEEVARQIAMAEVGLGVSLEEDVLPLFDGETAVAVYGADPMPSIVVATEVEDEAQALRTLDRIAERASAFLGGFEVEELELEGAQARRLALEDGNEFFYAASEGRLIAASAEATLRAALRGEGSLADDGDFGAAREAAGAPGETSGLAYADIEGIMRLALGSVVVDEPNEDVGRNLEPLRSLFLWGEEDDGWVTLEGLLEIE
jgi:hypothetical protein